MDIKSVLSSENPSPSSTPTSAVPFNGSTNGSGSGTSSSVFTSPLEDTSGLDVFAQIAASAHPLPVEPTVRRASISTTSSIVHQSQSQLAQSIYQSQQALRLQQQQQQQQQNNKNQPLNHHKRESFDSTISNFDPKITDDDIEFDEDDDEFYSESDSSTIRTTPGSKSSFLTGTSIKEETESDLMSMEVDHSIDFQQIHRRRSPSLTTSMDQPQIMATRRLSVPDTNNSNNLNSSANNISSTGGYSTRRVIHNICERKRRENIRDGFSQLQNRLPAHLANNPKLSKMEVLSGAKNLINEIRARISNLSAEISALSQVSEQMEKKSSIPS